MSSKPLKHSNTFLTTHWSVISKARNSEDSQEINAAMTKLCESYWFPVYAFIRSKGNSQTKAEDLTQSFFLHFIEKPFLNKVSSEKGKFRTYLCTSVKNYITNTYNHDQAQKRGGGKNIISLDSVMAEKWFESESAIATDSEAYFDKQWALSVLRNVFEELKADYDSSNQSELFDALKGHIQGDHEQSSYRDIGLKLDKTENSIKVAAHRLRSKYKKKLKKIIAESLSDESNIEEELNYLISCL